MTEIPHARIVPPSNTWRLAEQCIADSERWFGDTIPKQDAVLHHALSLAGEVGELCNLLKKVQRGSLDPSDAHTRYEIAMEITDVYIYLLNLAGIFGVDLEKSYEQKRAHNEHRFMEERRAREVKHD